MTTPALIAELNKLEADNIVELFELDMGLDDVSYTLKISIGSQTQEYFTPKDEPLLIRPGLGTIHSIDAHPQMGDLQYVNSEYLRYIPNPGITGTDSFTITVNEGHMYFHPGVNEYYGSIVFDKKYYSAYPVAASGFEQAISKEAARPKLVVSNILGGITALALEFDDLVGSKFIRERTFKKFLDDVNFVEEEVLRVEGLDGVVKIASTADPNAIFSRQLYYISRKTAENNTSVEFELSTAIDLQGVMLPKRQIIQNICPWKYRGEECGWVHDPLDPRYFNDRGIKVLDITDDKCGKKLTDCKKRFEERAKVIPGFQPILPYGGFPGSGLRG